MRDILDEAMKRVSSVAPLQQFVAVNPLNDLTEYSVDNAIRQMQKFSQGHFLMDCRRIFRAVNVSGLQKNILVWP